MSDRVLYIYGAGGHAKVVAAAARSCGYTIGGFWEDSTERVGMDFFGSRIVAFQEVPDGAFAFIAFGNNAIRLRRGRELISRFSFPSIIHPSAQIATGVEIGRGCYFGALSNVDPGCKIGDFCIVNNNANISHDTMLSAGCHICGGVNIAGNGRIGRCVLMGIGSCMMEELSIGDDAVVGAGSTVIRDIPRECVAVGCPAKIIKRSDDIEIK